MVKHWISCCLFFLAFPAASAEETVLVPVTLDNQPVKLEFIIHKPKQALSPLPTVVLNHGSTGYGRDPYLFTSKVNYFEALVDYFLAKNWAVVIPMRRGRGRSEGMYDEGFSEDREQGYTCNQDLSLAGAERALSDIDAAIDVIRAMPFVDAQHVVIGGISRGGILSIAYAGRHPEKVKGVLNFVGGWISENCYSAETINGSLSRMGAKYTAPSLWLYGRNDSFYSLGHSRQNYDAFLSAGGQGSFKAFDLGSVNGHLLGDYPDKWQETLDSYLIDNKLIIGK
ncbi:alpha/beta hydrolase family protein [Thaumasiovibrio sp. DFM-14]|uniref:alpha/beta hydrolase family protein n=1 Tax=Thaumasiovibrio sp. DFM-14 TaxID=3384792 RepID=UPI0039A1B6DB